MEYNGFCTCLFDFLNHTGRPAVTYYHIFAEGLCWDPKNGSRSYETLRESYIQLIVR